MQDKMKIVIIDDSDVVAMMLTEFLEEQGYEVLRAHNGVAGVELVYKEIPDLIIMDVEMPLLQGYQASRLLKTRRGVNAIPIIMHTSLSEDKDKYWALASGADAFCEKNFDNLDRLLTTVNSLAGKTKIDRTIIREDAKTVNKDSIFEMMGFIFDQQLFQSTIFNLLGEIGKMLATPKVTTTKILLLLNKICETHISLIIFQYKTESFAYILPSPALVKSDVEDFIPYCFNDYFLHFKDCNFSTIQKSVIGKIDKTAFTKIRIDNKKISSYKYWQIKSKGDQVIGTLHIGNFSNNYFSPTIIENIDVFVRGAGIILENSLLFTEIKEMKDRIRTLFSKFVPSEIINTLLTKSSDEELMTGEKRHIVVLFSDIRSFTTISEHNEAEDVVAFLNQYFNAQVNVIKKYGGYIDKFIGDAIFAVFGAPISYKDNALRAVNAAREMIQVLETIDISKIKIPGNKLTIGIGLHEGYTVVGNIGSSDKMDYTAIGDTVNLAARLESLTKHYHSPILVSEIVYNKVKTQVPFREVDYVKVKGKGIATSIFSLELEEKPEEYQTLYKKALKLYRLGNFQLALDYFTQLKDQDEADYIVTLYIQRIQDLIKDPPPDWDGSVALDFK